MCMGKGKGKKGGDRFVLYSTLSFFFLFCARFLRRYFVVIYSLLLMIAWASYILLVGLRLTCGGNWHVHEERKKKKHNFDVKREVWNVKVKCASGKGRVYRKHWCMRSWSAWVLMPVGSERMLVFPTRRAPGWALVRVMNCDCMPSSAVRFYGSGWLVVYAGR